MKLSVVFDRWRITLTQILAKRTSRHSRLTNSRLDLAKETLGRAVKVNTDKWH